MQPKIILASTSPRRKELLKKMGVDFEAMPPFCDENRNEKLTLKQQVEDLAARKASDVFQRTSGNRIVIGSDTMAEFGGKLVGKPKDKDDARRMLTAFSGKTHHFITGLCVWSELDGVIRKQVGHGTGSVTFRTLSQEEIETYIETSDPYDKAGGYDAITNPISASFVIGRGGSISAVTGLPVELLEKFLAAVM